MITEKRDIEEFLLARGGPFYELQQQLGLVRENAFRTASRASLFVMLAWGVPLVLSAVEGNAVGTPAAAPYLLEFAPWARFFIAVGLFMLMEPQVEERIRNLLAQFVRQPILAPGAFEAAAKAVNQALQRRDAPLTEAICAILAILATLITLFRLLDADTASWVVRQSPEGYQLTMAGWWCVVVSNLIFGFLLLRWLWRHTVLTMLLRDLASLELRLVVTHPDGHGGLAFIGQYPNAYTTFVFAVSCVIAAAVAHELLNEGLSLTAYGVIMALWLLIVLAFFAQGLLAFRKPLSVLKDKTLQASSAQAIRHHRAVERELLGRNMSAAEDAESASAAEVSDASKLFESARKLPTLLVSRAGLLPVTTAALVPLVIAGATVLPFKEILTIAKRLLLL
jgi:hypothetical protein